MKHGDVFKPIPNLKRNLSCDECKGACDVHNSKHLKGKTESLEWDIRLCHDCYFANERLVESVSALEETEKRIQQYLKRLDERLLITATNGFLTLKGDKLWDLI